MLKVEAKYPDNRLLHGRGLPGTHDMELMSTTLEKLQSINSRDAMVDLPVYDKSLFNGQGDRLSKPNSISGPLDIILFEGWCMGFSAMQPERLLQLYDDEQTATKESFFPAFTANSLLEMNQLLKQFDQQLYNFIDAFVVLAPSDPLQVFHWRKEAEDKMKAANGGKGMTDIEVRNFVSR